MSSYIPFGNFGGNFFPEVSQAVQTESTLWDVPPVSDVHYDYSAFWNTTSSISSDSFDMQFPHISQSTALQSVPFFGICDQFSDIEAKAQHSYASAHLFDSLMSFPDDDLNALFLPAGSPAASAITTPEFASLTYPLTGPSPTSSSSPSSSSAGAHTHRRHHDDDTHDTVVCEWAGCGMVLPSSRRARTLHFRDVHHVQSANAGAQRCHWASCVHVGIGLRKHLGAHMGEGASCSDCGDQLARQDVLARHRRSGTCFKCTACHTRFETVAERCQHVVQGMCAGKRPGRPRVVARAERRAQPY